MSGILTKRGEALKLMREGQQIFATSHTSR